MPWRHPLSLRLKIVFWMLGIFGIVQITLATVILFYERSAVYGIFDKRLLRQAELFQSRLGPSIRPGSDSMLRSLADSENSHGFFSDLFIAVFDERGHLIASSSHGDPLARSGISMKGHSIDQPFFEWVDASTSVRLSDELTDELIGRRRLVALPFKNAGEDPRVLVVASLDTYARAMFGEVLRIMLLASPTAFVAAFVGGWFLAGLVIAPLEKMRKTATTIQPGALKKAFEVQQTSREIARLEEELNSALERIEEGYRSQARFISNVSHEMKTPISVLLTEAQTLRDVDHCPEDVQAFVRSSEDELRRLGRTIESFLMLSRIRDGKTQSDAHIVPVNDLVMDSILSCASYARQERVGLEPALIEPGDRALDVLGDPELLRTMLDNLVRNAIRFSPANDCVRVVAQYSDTDPSFEIRVIDNGPGIPEEARESIFDRYHQAPAEARNGRGYGLGLEIAQGVAEIHGGRIDVKNGETGGCEFRVRLPFAMRPATTSSK